jgi:1,4-alpha-glucan branching enzyme
MLPKITITEIDTYLKPYTAQLEKRRQKIVLKELEFTDGKCKLSDCFNNHLYYGLHKTENNWIFREKAPFAKKIYIYGDFSHWQLEEQFSLHSLENGDWEIDLSLDLLRHKMLYKLWICWENGSDERIPAYAKRVVQDEQTKVFSAQVWDPEQPYLWQHQNQHSHSFHYIYETHIGMSSNEGKVSNYQEFEEKILPRIKDLGYNTIQLMAIQEHPYYGSFGYQVANFYAPSSRFGTPEELKHLIDKAHEWDIDVILDIVHSHSVANEKEGLSRFDGSDDLYFHNGNRGKHPVWDSRLFNYGKNETLAFLLSNVKYWLEEFHFDGLRFDGVTSMCYAHHGIGIDFVNYDQYFDNQVDNDALVYLALANKIVKEVNSTAITIAEDVSGMPGMAFPIEKGGIGFDYRMSMGIADFWGNLIKNISDEHWLPSDIFFRLTDKRYEEHTISYAESHDQALVGDKTLIFRLIDKEMYFSMSRNSSHLLVDRGIALHKIIRLLTLSLADGGYLNFMGNEFGHPEWIDFPRQGNGWSFQYALRRWDLSDNQELKYHFLQDFDKAMIQLSKKHSVFDAQPKLLLQNNADQVLAYQRNGILFVVNLSPSCSFSDYGIACKSGTYNILLNTDSPVFGGFGNVNETMNYFTTLIDGKDFIKLYLPARTAIVLGKK